MFQGGWNLQTRKQRPKVRRIAPLVGAQIETSTRRLLAALREIGGWGALGRRRFYRRGPCLRCERPPSPISSSRSTSRARPRPSRSMGNCFTAGRSRPELPASRLDGSYTPFRMEACITAGMGQCRHAACDLLHQAGPQHPWLRPSRPRHARPLRLRPRHATNATTLYDLVTAEGMGNHRHRERG